ncbi:MAG: hypothetical protein K0R57_5173 [Paenibacillaceae bacterium]|jgi:polyisoprenoid-binding protein YceI|nr:hypothetical protein [Paenibacillaceae bacterium]
MKKWRVAIIVSTVVVLVGAGVAYAAYDYYAGNSVEVKSVIATSSPGAASPGASATPAAAVEAASVDGLWTIQAASEVYFSVTTSRETVNFSVKPVTGSWQLNSSDPAQNKGEGSVELANLSSGNSQRDNHIKGNDYLQVAQYPNATFTTTSFEQLPEEWKEGEAVPIRINGTLSLRGLSKDVAFDSKAQFIEGKLNLEGSTVVTFDDFGMKNPHTVLLNTQNDVTVQLRLILAK